MPDADAIGAPEGALLRADNLVLDEKGALALRKGSSIVYSSLGAAESDVHSLKTVIANGTKYQLAGVSDKVFSNGSNLGVSFNGTGDVAFGSDAYQAFMARGSTKKKIAATGELQNWGIAAPDQAPLLAALDVVTATVASFNSAESPALVVNESASTSFQLGHDGVTANGALEVVPNAGTGRASIQKVFTSDQDFFHVNGALGSGTDLFDIFTWIEEPGHAWKITIMFGMGTGADPFIDDYYYFRFNFKDPATVDVKDPASNAAAAIGKSADKIQSVLTPDEVTRVKTPSQVSDILKRIGRFAGPRSPERRDSLAASPAWAHLSVTRGQFNRVGGSDGKDWTTIRGFKIVYEALPGSIKKVWFDDAVWYGGGDRALTGSFKCVYRFVNSTGNYLELSPVSPPSNDIVLTQQGLQVTIPAAAIAGSDEQVNQVWIYLFGGFLDTYYRFIVSGNSTTAGGMKIDEFAIGSSAGLDSFDRTRYVNQGFSINNFSSATESSDFVVSIRKSELDAIIENETLEPGCVQPPDNIVAIEGPFNGRMFCLTSEGWLYVSSQTSPSNFSVYHVLDLRRYGTPYWLARSNGAIHAGMSGDIIRIDGTADETPDHISVDLAPDPLHVGNPPVDSAVFTDGSTVVYRAADGLMTLLGVGTSPVNEGLTSLLWRGKARHGVQPLNITGGRFRLAVDNHILYMLAPEGDSTDSTTVIWRYADRASGEKAWFRTSYPYSFRSIHREPDGDLIAGDIDGNVILLEDGVQDNALDIPVEILTPIEDGGSPLSRKDPNDIQLHVLTGGNTGTLSVYLDGSVDSSQEYAFSTSSPNIYRIQATSLSPFTRSQFRITGSFFSFILNAYNIFFDPRPQQMVSVFTSAIMPPGSRDLAWLAELEFDVCSPVDLEAQIWIDDVLHGTLPVAINSERQSVYRTRVPKGWKGRRPRILLKTTNADGAGDIGFECWSIRVRLRGSGNETAKDFFPIYPAGSAA